jgi:hypothetical protein
MAVLIVAQGDDDTLQDLIDPVGATNQPAFVRQNSGSQESTYGRIHLIGTLLCSLRKCWQLQCQRYP